MLDPFTSSTNVVTVTETVSARRVLALAIPALGVLVAMPLFLLIDTAAVGRLGGISLAALGTAATIFSTVSTQLTFLSYGTTARSARLFGAGKRKEAVAEGVQATWIAIFVGSALALIILVGAPWFSLWLSGSHEVAEHATTWLRIAAFAIPMALIDMAGNGWLRGIQNTRLPLYFTLAGVIPGAALIPFMVSHFGLQGSAWATLICMAITSALFLVCLIRAHEGSWAPKFVVMKKQLAMGRDLILRSLSFQVSFISAAAVAGRFGADSLAAHQVMLQLWNFLTLVLDALAIAAQTLTGAALGAGSVAAARSVGVKTVAYTSAISLGLAAIFGAGYHVIPRMFTDDGSVLATIAGPWWILVALILIGGVVFALDGVLLGASDAAYLRNISLGAALVGFLPGVWLALALDAGLIGVWCGLGMFIVLRLVAVLWRFQSMKWARVE